MGGAVSRNHRRLADLITAQTVPQQQSVRFPFGIQIASTQLSPASIVTSPTAHSAEQQVSHRLVHARDLARLDGVARGRVADLSGCDVQARRYHGPLWQRSGTGLCAQLIAPTTSHGASPLVATTSRMDVALHSVLAELRALW